ncbi:MAG: fibronectin type III domain-containing protein, partial [Proteobacteria bacterium]|nr:fibronectin type III domain-containing protein [Pseudomonadota bacterium]
MKRFLSFHAVLFFFAVSFVSFAEEKGRLSASELAPGASDAFFFSNAAGADTQCDEGSGVDCCDGTLQETFSGVTRFTTSYCKGRYAGRASSTRYGIRFDTFHAFRSILNENQLVLANSNAGCTSADCCPTSGSKTYNWLLLRARPFDNYSSPMDMSLDTTYVGGTITYAHSQTVKWSGTSKFSLNKLDAETKTDSTAYGARLFGSSTCSAGEFRANAVTDFTAANRPLGNYGYWLFGKNVAFYRQVGADPVIAVAFPRPATSLSASGIMASKNRQVFAGNYTGFTTRGVQVQRNVMLIPDAAGTTFTLSEVADPSNPFSVSTLGTLACTNLDEPSQGFCRGTLSLTAVPGFTGKATCMMAYDIGNRDLVFCSAQNPSADSNHRRALITIAAVSSHKSVLTMTASPVHLDANTSSGQMCATVENKTSRAVDTLSLTGNLSGDFSSASLSGSVTSPFSGLVGPVPACGTSLPAFSKCKICSTVTLASQKVSAHALTVTYGDAPSSTKSISETAVATRGVSTLQYEVSKVTHNKTPSIKAIFANGTTQNIDAIKEKLQCNGTCTSELGTRSLAYTLEGLESASAVGDVLVSTEEELCYNDEDDDNDGTTDCLDNDCDSERGDISNASLLCNYGPERDCSDEFDNDKDGLTDFDDSDCGAVISLPISLIADVKSSNRIDLNWASGGPLLATYQIAYQLGANAPVNCSAGTVIPAATQGAATVVSVTGLNPSSQYSFRVCLANALGDLSSGTTVSARTFELDTVPPALALFQLNGGALYSTSASPFSVNATLSASDDNG